MHTAVLSSLSLYLYLPLPPYLSLSLPLPLATVGGPTLRFIMDEGGPAVIDPQIHEFRAFDARFGGLRSHPV